jgi:mono/diheme cytochrome c family protein
MFKPIRSNLRLPILLFSSSLLVGGILMASHVETPLEAAAAPAAVTAADSGQAVYEQHCLSCHAVDGKGSDNYPPLASDDVKKKLGTYDKAYEFISQNMPLNAPGSLREDDYKAVTTYILSLNGIPTAFGDIDKHWANKEIVELFDKKFIDGYKQDNTLLFKPDQNITRAEFVRYLVKSKQLFLSNSTDTAFSDLANNKDDKTFIITAVEYGFIDGYPDQTFRPKNLISRAEIAAILVRSEMLKAVPGTAFTDVPADYWAAEAIRAVKQANLFDGYENGTFRPVQNMTRGEAIAVIYRLIHPVQ